MNDCSGELSTIKDWIRWGASQFHAAQLFSQTNFADALSESQALVLHALHFRTDAFTHHATDFFASTVTADEKIAIHTLLKKRITSQKPSAYLTNHAWFAGLDFFVDERVLVPRSPIAELIEQQFSPWIDYSQVHTVLDLCTGSGCIAIACAYAFPKAQIDAIDISEDTLAVAEINRSQHGVEKQLTLLQGDLFAPLKHGKQYDIIVSNPPYVDAQDMVNLPKEMQHEPAIGLAAGKDGLAIATRIIETAAQHLTDHGILIMEVGNSQAALSQHYPDLPFAWLEFQHGGHGVCLLSKQQLNKM